MPRSQAFVSLLLARGDSLLLKLVAIVSSGSDWSPFAYTHDLEAVLIRTSTELNSEQVVAVCIQLRCLRLRGIISNATVGHPREQVGT